jgi:hypothetical protein
MQIQGIDKYAKETAKNKKKSTVQIKGAVVEINAIKNIIIKSQQLTSEYTAAKEEYNQFKSLGISTKSDLVL